MDRLAGRPRLSWLLRTLGARRTRVFTLAAVVTLAFLILPSWYAWNAYRASEQLSAHELQLQRVAATVVHLDEVRTMSARMAAATGERGWERRYQRFAPQLEEAMRQMIRLAAGSYAAAAERTEAANQVLVRLENQALALVREGKSREAAEVLSSPAYREYQGAFTGGVRFLTTTIDERFQDALQRSERRLVGAGALTVLSAVTLLAAWVGVFALLWRHRTQRERAEREHRYLEAQIQHLQKLESLGVMAGGIAHDFNNLLMPILGQVDLVLGDLPASSPAGERLKRIRAAAARLSELTSKLLAYTGKSALEMRPLDLSQLVREMSELLRMSVSKRVDLEFDLEDGLPAVDADSSQVGQVAMNLVLNASEAMGGESGTVTVRTGLMHAAADYLSESHSFEERPEGPYVYLEVADPGCGMDAATRRQLFDPFFTTKFTGRGLGLAVVLGIVRGHRGAVHVESEPGRGTTFRILFPRSDRAAEPLARRAPATAPWRASGTVLVVDDEADVRELAEEMLRRLDYEVITAREGSEAVAALRTHADKIDVVLLDLTMPGLSGEETLREIRSIEPDQEVVLMSGYSEEFAGSRFEGRIAGFLQKPFTREELGEALARCTGSGSGPSLD